MKYEQADVINAVKKNKDSFSSLYNDIYPDLYKMAYYIVGDKHWAEDIVSETVLDAFDGISKLKNTDKFEQWILKILTTKCKKHFKSKYNNFSVYNPNVRNLDDYDVKSDDTLYDIDSKTDIQNALLKLSIKDRTIISLCIVEGYKSHEVAEILSMNSNTVRSHLNRALFKMKNYLEV